jgi:hypothetical protein
MPSRTFLPAPIAVTIAGGPGNPVHIEQGLDRQGLPGYEIKSSRAFPVPGQLPGWLPASTAWLIEDRIEGAGQRKGRVLMILRGTRLVAVCSWHREDSGPPAVFDLACHPKLKRSERDRVEQAMLLALRCISAAMQRTTLELRFADHPLDRAPKNSKAIWKGQVRDRAAALEFTERLRPLPRFYKNRWSRRRTWSSFP